MRDIKFRAWNFQLKKYIKAIEMNITGNMVRTWDEKFYAPFEVVLEQYTGLKDKNGVEIYENDVVKPVEEDVDFENEYYQIVYNETGNYPAFDLRGWTGEVNGISELSLTYGIEVIGNIHENADLLEEQS